jgi:hypothetical protein
MKTIDDIAYKLFVNYFKEECKRFNISKEFFMHFKEHRPYILFYEQALIYLRKEKINKIKKVYEKRR